MATKKLRLSMALQIRGAPFRTVARCFM